MSDYSISAPGDDDLPKHTGWRKRTVDMLLGNRITFHKRTRSAPSLQNVQDGHKQSGLLTSDANQALDLSWMPNHAQDASGRAPRTAQIAAPQSEAQRPKWGGPGGKKMTPRELAAYEAIQRHLRQPFQPIDLFREIWGDNHAEPAFWSGVPRESHIKYYAEHNGNTGRKISHRAHTCNLQGRPRHINEEEQDGGERNDDESPSPQKKPGILKKFTADFSGHDKSHYSDNYQELPHTPEIYRGAGALNAYNTHVQEDKFFGYSESMSPFVFDGHENFLPANLAQRRATQSSGDASRKIRNYRGISFKSSNPARVSHELLHQFENPSRLPESKKRTKSWSATNESFDEFEGPPRFAEGDKQYVQQQKRCERETIIGDLIQHIQLGHEINEQQLAPQQQRREGKSSIDDIILEIPLAHHLAKEKREEAHHHAVQHYSLLRSASEGSVLALGRANRGRKMSAVTTVDSDGAEHRHSISEELLRTTSIPGHGKHKTTSETRVSNVHLNGLPRPTFTPASRITKYQVDDYLPEFALSPEVKQENANKKTLQQLEKRQSANRRTMRACFGVDGTGDEKPERELGTVGSKKLPHRHHYSGFSSLDGRLAWPTADVDKTSGSYVSPLVDLASRPPSSADNHAKKGLERLKQKRLDEILVKAEKTGSEKLQTTATPTAEVSLKEAGSSNNPFSHKLRNDSSVFQQSSRRPSSPSKKVEDLLNQYDAKLDPGSRLPHKSAGSLHLSPMNPLRSLFKVRGNKDFRTLPADRPKLWPPQPTIEEEEEDTRRILPEEPLLLKHVMIEVAHSEPSLCTDEPTIPKEVCKVSSATESANFALRTDDEPVISKEERMVYFAIPPNNVSHQSTKVTGDEKLTTTNVVHKANLAPRYSEALPCPAEKPALSKPIRMISDSIDYGLFDGQMSMDVISPKSNAHSTIEWSLEKSESNQRKVEKMARSGKEVPLNVVPRLYRKTDVAAHSPEYMEICKGRTTDKGDFDGYMAVLPSHLQDPDFALIRIRPGQEKEEKIVPTASRCDDAYRCVPDLFTHVGGTFRHLFDGEPSMTTNPENVPLPKSLNGGSFAWNDEEADDFYDLEDFNTNHKYEEVNCFDIFKEGCVNFEDQPSVTAHLVNVPVSQSPNANSFIWDDDEVHRSESLEGLESLNVPPDPESDRSMKLKRHFSSSWRPFPHKIIEPNFVSIPTIIRFRIYQMLLPFSHRHPVLLSPVATTLKFWPERSFRSPSDVFDKIGAMTLVNRQVHDEMMAFYLSQMRFHITLNCRVAESLVPEMSQWLPLFAHQMQYLTIEIDFTKGSGNYKDGCALRSDGVAELEKLLKRVMVPLSKRKAPMRGLTIMARRYEGVRPSGQLVPFKTTTSPYQGNEIIRGEGLGKAEQPDEENWSMIDGLAALSGFGEEDDTLFYSLHNQKPNKENRWKNWFNLKFTPTKPVKPRTKLGRTATAHRSVQNRRPSGFKVTALRLLTGKSPMPEFNDARVAKPNPSCSPMSSKLPPEPPRQKSNAHFSQPSLHGSREFTRWGAPSTSQTTEMSPSSAQAASAGQRVFVPTSEAFRDPLPLFDGRRGSAMMGDWSNEVETALGASVAAIEAKEEALEAHTEYGYDEEQNKRLQRIARIKKIYYDRTLARRLKREPHRWFPSKNAARRKRVALQQTKHSPLHGRSRHGRHKKALGRRHEKINMARNDKSFRRRTMPKYKYRIFHAMEQLHRGSIPSKVTVFTRKDFFRTRKGRRHVAFLKRPLQNSRAGMMMSSPYLPHDAADNILETLVACFGPPDGPGFLFLRLAGFTVQCSEEICMKLVCKAMPTQLTRTGRQLWPKESVGTFGKRRAGARFARFEVFEEANSIPERRGRIIKVEDKKEEQQESNDSNKDLTDEDQQCEDRKKDLPEKPQLDEEKGLAGVLGPVVGAQVKRAEGFDAQRATMKKKANVEHKHVRQEFEFKTVHGMRKKRKSKAMEAMEAADSIKGTTHVSRFLQKQFKKARSRVGERRKWRASGMEDDDYDDYRAFR